MKRIGERVAYQIFNLHLTFACRTHQVFSHRAESERINAIIARNPVMPLQVRNKESVWFFGTLLVTANECPHSSTSSCINFSIRSNAHTQPWTRFDNPVYRKFRGPVDPLQFKGGNDFDLYRARGFGHRSPCAKDFLMSSMEVSCFFLKPKKRGGGDQNLMQNFLMSSWEVSCFFLKPKQRGGGDQNLMHIFAQ
jgi:hypothetical protein